MPNLGDFLGHLMSEITIARMQADIEAVRIAELYASNPLLANLPVPHFRLPNIEIDVPVVIQTVEEPAGGTSVRGGPLISEMQNKFSEVLGNFLKEELVELRPAERRKLDKSIEKSFAELSRNVEIASNINQVADKLSDVVSMAMAEVGGPVDKEKRERVRNSIKKVTRFEFLKLSKPPARLKALVTTTEIKAAGPSDVITRLHLKLNEEAFEWTTVESDGNRTDRLVTE